MDRPFHGIGVAVWASAHAGATKKRRQPLSEVQEVVSPGIFAVAEQKKGGQHQGLSRVMGTMSSQKAVRVWSVLVKSPSPPKEYPVGRLDKESTGLLLLTNDGNLHHRLSHPSFDHEKEYDVTISKPLGDGALRKLAQGLTLMGRKTRPAVVRKISSRRFRIVLKEGRNRQIRKMCEKAGLTVQRLVRTHIDNISISGMRPGQWVDLPDSVVSEFRYKSDENTKPDNRP